MIVPAPTSPNSSQTIEKIISFCASGRNHPKFPMFLGAVAQNAVEEGTIIEINVTAPNGAHYETNLKLRAEDLEFIRALQEMGK